MASNPPVRLPLSYVRRTGPTIHLQLQLGGSDALPETGKVRLVNGGRVLEGSARITESDVTGRLLSADIPAGSVDEGRWLVRVAFGADPAETDFTTVAARVLIAAPNPISLLLGKTTPEEVPAERSGQADPNPARRAAAVLGRAADRVLSELPPDKAQASRERIRKTVRRILP